MKSKKHYSTSGLNCGYCGKEFKYDSERKRHEQSHSPQFECKVCSKKFSFLSAVRRHEKQHERVGNVVCKECNRKFRDESLLKRHIKYAHKGSFTCSKCEATFSSELALRSHAKSHKPVAERRYQCSFHGCSKSFNFTHHLKHHELTHTNSKQYYCNVCGKGFIQSHHLKSHKKTHEPEKWLPCKFPDCKKTFPTEYSRKKHIATHHKDIKSDESTSDVNSSSEVTDLIETDTITCTSCKQILLREHYADHLRNCLITNDSRLDSNSPKVDEPVLTKLEPVKIDFTDDLSSCKSFVGGCIIGAHANDNEKCLCAQISAALPVDYYEISINNSSNNCDSKQIEERELVKPTISDKNDACEGCECACSYKPRVAKTNDFDQSIDTPDIEYRSDGTIRIKTTFDLDMETSNERVDLVPYNSCKDVLGNCIVSGNGTIGEGCLCARMAIDDQQMSAQEIDELTPCPETVSAKLNDAPLEF